MTFPQDCQSIFYPVNFVQFNLANHQLPMIQIVYSPAEQINLKFLLEVVGRYILSL